MMDPQTMSKTADTVMSSSPTMEEMKFRSRQIHSDTPTIAQPAAYRGDGYMLHERGMIQYKDTVLPV